MRKIISLFVRDRSSPGVTTLVRDEVTPGAEWVLAGEGVATRKWDGTCCLVRNGNLWKRYDAKQGKAPPEGFEAAQEPDPVTGHWPGWLRVVRGRPDDRWHFDAWDAMEDSPPDGTYELCGPKVNGNREKLADHVLIRHGADVVEDPRGALRSFEGIRDYLAGPRGASVEGIVWHHPDGRMVKIKARDFGAGRSVS